MRLERKSSFLWHNLQEKKQKSQKVAQDDPIDSKTEVKGHKGVSTRQVTQKTAEFYDGGLLAAQFEESVFQMVCDRG